MAVKIPSYLSLSAIIGIFFQGLFFVSNDTETRKKSLKIQSENSRTLFPQASYFKDFFHRTFKVPNFKTLFPKTFFENIFGGYNINFYIIISQ